LRLVRRIRGSRLKVEGLKLKAVCAMLCCQMFPPTGASLYKIQKMTTMNLYSLKSYKTIHLFITPELGMEMCDDDHPVLFHAIDDLSDDLVFYMIGRLAFTDSVNEGMIHIIPEYIDPVFRKKNTKCKAYSFNVKDIISIEGKL